PGFSAADNTFAIGRFDHRASQEFLKNSGLHLTTEAIEELLRGAARREEAPGLFRPITLNLIGLAFSRTPGRIAAAKDPSKMIEHYFEAVLSKPEIRHDAALLLDSLLDTNGRRMIWPVDQLAEAINLPEWRVRHCLVELANMGIVRTLNDD